MPTLDAARPDAPCWIELFTTDVAVARAFYHEVFGWESGEPDPTMGGYFNFTRNGKLMAGGMANDGSTGMPSVWSTYLTSADIDASVARAVAAGATVAVPATQVMELGSMAVVVDPGGATIGLWQPGTHPGFEVVAEDDCPAWFELHTRAYDESVSFYGDALGLDLHTMADTEDFRYTTIGVDDASMGGIMDDAVHGVEEAPAHWDVYFQVADADAFVAKAVGLGASVSMEPADTPYGRLAVLADPTGAAFSIMAPPA